MITEIERRNTHRVQEAPATSRADRLSPGIPATSGEPRPDRVERDALADVLTEIADTAAETLELQQVFAGVATALRRLVPLDAMGVVRILDEERSVLHATTVPCPKAPQAPEDSGCERGVPTPLVDWSPRLRPRPGPIPRVDDAAVELDPTFPADRRPIEKGVHSTLWEPFRTAGSFDGGVWASSLTPYAFTAEHQRVLRPVAALLGSAVEHWRIWDAERHRRERLDRLESILATLAESLDVREVFVRLSEAMQPVLEHHLMALTHLDLRDRTIRVVAHAGEPDAPPPEGPVALTDEESDRRGQDFELMSDLCSQLAGDTERERILEETGMRSWLRVPVHRSGEVAGGLSFFHREPGRFSRGDAEVASRLADRLALTLSHQQLAEEARLVAEVQQRAERLEARVETLMRELRTKHRIVGASPAWKQVLQDVQRVAAVDTTVLVTGESGTGKEVVANLVHDGSPRAEAPLVAINCAALPEQLLESELFGHEKGAFTGAVGSRMGRIEQAAGGTLFLDEIGEMSPMLQAKLLRVLQEKEFQRLGGTRVLRAEVRIVAATNRDIEAAMRRGEFREDLYYRLNVFAIHVPPLRERPEDILALAEQFLEELGRSMGRPAAGISREAREWLLDHHWPGNVRELRNAIERAILLCDGGLVTREHLPVGVGRPEPAPGTALAGLGNGNGKLPAGGVDLASVERDLVEKALEQADGNRSRAARLLGITRSQLYTRLTRYELD